MKKQFQVCLSLFIVLALVLINCGKKKDDPAPGTTPPPTTTALTVTNVNPASGGEGTKVVITGTGFSATQTSNKVKFGATEAVLDSATATRLVTKVPKGATTGKVTVEVGGKTASSSVDFTVSAATTPAAFSTDNISSDITAETAKVSSTLTANGGAAITQYGHVWSDTKPDPTTADAKTELGKTDGPFPLKFTSDLKSLKANTAYNVRAYATNDKGTSYGTAVQVKTATAPVVITNPDDAETIYVGANYTTYAFDAATGKQKGQFGVTGGTAYAAPAIDKTRLYTGYSSVLAYDLANSRKAWEYLGLAGQFTNDMTVDNGVLYVPTDKELFALDAATSTKKWGFAATSSNVLTSPVAIGNVIYIVGGAGMYALDAATGTRKWAYQANLQTGVAISGGIAYATGAPNTLHAVDIATGTKKWTYQMGTTFGSLDSYATVANNIVYVGSGDKKLYAVDATTGAKKWDFLTGSDLYSSPAVANGLVYIYSTDKNLYAVDATTGAKKWNAKVGGSTGNSSPVVVNGVVYISGEGKTLYAFDSVTGTEKWRVITAENQTSSPTVVAKNGKVYYSARSGAQQ